MGGGNLSSDGLVDKNILFCLGLRLGGGFGEEEQ